MFGNDIMSFKYPKDTSRGKSRMDQLPMDTIDAMESDHDPADPHEISEGHDLGPIESYEHQHNSS